MKRSLGGLSSVSLNRTHLMTFTRAAAAIKPASQTCISGRAYADLQLQESIKHTVSHPGVDTEADTGRKFILEMLLKW